jgi:hypothetical protein
LTKELGDPSGKRIQLIDVHSGLGWLKLGRRQTLVVRVGGWRSVFRASEPSIDMADGDGMEAAMALALSILRDTSIRALIPEAPSVKPPVLRAFAGLCAFRGVTLLRTDGIEASSDDIVVVVRERDLANVRLQVRRPSQREFAVPLTDVPSGSTT